MFGLFRSRETNAGGGGYDRNQSVGSFYGVTHNPVRVEIAELRELRDAGMLSAADYAVRVSALINGQALPSM